MSSRPRRSVGASAGVLAVAAALTVVLSAQPATPTRPHHPDTPYQSPTSLGVAGYAKILCSAIFVSGRASDEARLNSASFLLPAPDRGEAVTVHVDRVVKRVQASVRGVVRTAAFYGDQGCVIHPEGQDRVFFTPTPVRTTLPDAATTPWPMGDAPSPAPWPPGLDQVNGEGQWNLPRDAYFMSGAGGQQTFVVPSHDLVVVRLGHQRGAAAGAKTLNQSLAAITAAIDASR